MKQKSVEICVIFIILKSRNSESICIRRLSCVTCQFRSSWHSSKVCVCVCECNGLLPKLSIVPTFRLLLWMGIRLLTDYSPAVRTIVAGNHRRPVHSAYLVPRWKKTIFPLSLFWYSVSNLKEIYWRSKTRCVFIFTLYLRITHNSSTTWTTFVFSGFAIVHEYFAVRSSQCKGFACVIKIGQDVQ